MWYRVVREKGSGSKQVSVHQCPWVQKLSCFLLAYTAQRKGPEMKSGTEPGIKSSSSFYHLLTIWPWPDYQSVWTSGSSICPVSTWCLLLGWYKAGTFCLQWGLSVWPEDMLSKHCCCAGMDDWVSQQQWTACQPCAELCGWSLKCMGWKRWARRRVKVRRKPVHM